MKSLKILSIFLFVILLVSCAGQTDYLFEVEIHTSPISGNFREITRAPSMTAVPSITLTPTSTRTRTPTLVPSPTITNTLAPTVIVTPTRTVVAPTVVTQNVIYVSLTGNNANNGTDIAPYRTIQYAINQARAGDVIYVRAGTYSEYVVISKSGADGAPITLMSYPGEIAVLDGGSNVALRSSGVVAYWNITNMTIQSTNRYTTRFGWWGETGVHNIVFRNNVLIGANLILGYNSLYENNDVSGVGYTASNGDAGLMEISSSHHNIFRGNKVHDFTKYNARGIWSQGLTHDSIFDANIVTNIWSTSGGLGQCIDLDGAGNVEWRHSVTNNIVKECSYVGIQLENVFDTEISGNTIDSEGSSGIILINYTSSVGCKVGGESNQYGDTDGDGTCKDEATDILISNNVIRTQQYWAWGYGGIVDWGVNLVSILNNTFYAGSYNESYPAINITSGVTDITSQGNVINIY